MEVVGKTFGFKMPSSQYEHSDPPHVGALLFPLAVHQSSTIKRSTESPIASRLKPTEGVVQTHTTKKVTKRRCGI